MNGATALDCENTISRPNSTKTTTIGTSQYFFSCRRNWTNSASTRDLAMGSSIHSVEVFLVAIPGRVFDPPGIIGATPRQWIAPHQPPRGADRRQHEQERQRQQHPRVHPPEHRRKRPPCVARDPNQH